MVMFVLRRLGSAVPVVFGITIVAFLLVHVVPGDPAQAILFGSNAARRRSPRSVSSSASPSRCGSST